MKKLQILLPLFLLPLFLLTGCKEDNWMDWKVKNELWLKQNLLNDSSVIQTSSGLQYKILHKGNTTDAKPGKYSTVYIDYKGWLINGYVFDQAAYASLNLSSVVTGFCEGLQKIYPGGDIMLYIPYDLAYGEEGSGSEGGSAFIPPYSTLVFEIHLCAVSN